QTENRHVRGASFFVHQPAQLYTKARWICRGRHSFELFVYVLQFGLRQGYRNAWLQSHSDRPRRIRSEWHPQWNDNVGEVGSVVTRNHTNDGERLAIEPECLSDCVWLAGEAALPERVCQHRDRPWLGPDRRFGFAKHPPEQRLNAKYRWRVTAER